MTEDNQDEHEAERADLWRQLEEHLARYQSRCSACAGDGMCADCRGYGRFIVRGLGSFACAACIGDGACTGCDGPGQALHP